MSAKGFHVSIIGPASVAYGRADVLVSRSKWSENYGWFECRETVAVFSDREEAIAFARETFEPLGYKVAP